MTSPFFKFLHYGTYWYDTHQDGVNQLSKGLYGTFIVEGNGIKPDRHYTLVLDEWMSQEANENNSTQNMDHSQMTICTASIIANAGNGARFK